MAPDRCSRRVLSGSFPPGPGPWITRENQPAPPTNGLGSVGRFPTGAPSARLNVAANLRELASLPRGSLWRYSLSDSRSSVRPPGKPGILIDALMYSPRLLGNP